MGEQTPIWEEVHKGDPEVRATWHSPAVYVCRACQKEKPSHADDCPIAALEAKLEAMERAIEAARREIGSIRCPEDERYARNALIVLAAAAQQKDK